MPTKPVIPLIDLGTAGLDELARRMPDRTRMLCAAAGRQIGRPVLSAMDRRSRRWLAANETPYAAEIDAVAAIPGVFGAHGLNLSTEWACTSATSDGRLVRILDWPIRGLGGAIVVARHESPAGAWLNVTWPGFVGVLTGLAPGRFAIAYNQAPICRVTGLRPVDWVLERVRLGPRTAIPATHLLRRVYEICPDFDAALAMLRETPIAHAGLFTLAGAGGEAAIVEKSGELSVVHPGPGAIPNHWLNSDWQGHARGVDSHGRMSQACTLLPRLRDLQPDFGWMAAPMLNHLTRLAVIADLRLGTFAVLGLDRDKGTALPATECCNINILKDFPALSA
ncbi:MAG TPA: hypothetical protein VGM59_05995 [Dongiaceae bacterium]|jgi:hypothetical protein